jgi:hypothetical protein
MLKPLAALAVALALSSCARASQPAPRAPDPAPAAPDVQPEVSTTPGSPAPCANGQEWYTPGPGDNALPARGCYTRCDAATCPSGQACRTVVTNPCGETEDGQVKSCMAVSQDSRVCLAA